MIDRFTIDMTEILNQPNRINGSTKGDGAWIHWMPAKYASVYGIVFAEQDGYIWIKKPKSEWLPQNKWFKDAPVFFDGKHILKRFTIDIKISNNTGGSMNQTMVPMVPIDSIIACAIAHNKKGILKRYQHLKKVLLNLYNYE